MGIRICGAALIWIAAGAAPALAEEAPRPAAEPRMTVVNASSHCDWAWTHSRAWHAERYAETIRQVLLLMREHPAYVWQLENANEQLAPFLQKAAKDWPGLIDEFWRRVREGRIEVIVAYSNPRLTEVYPETLVRNLVLGKHYFRQHAPGIEQKVYDAVDLMCGPSQMPQILAQAEYRYFMFSRPVGQQAVFWRKGLDGTRMLTSRSFYGYDAMGKFGEGFRGIKPVSVWRLAIGGDDVLPDPELPKQAAAWDSSKKVLATVARYFEEVERSGDQLTELEGVLDSLEHYHSAGTHGTRNLYLRNNLNEDLVLSAEKAEAMASALGEKAPIEPMDQLWRDQLSCTGHAILWLWKDDYDERLARCASTKADAEKAIADALAAVARRVPPREGLGRPLVVFNFHAWPVTGPVEFAAQEGTEGVALRDASGAEVPVQPVPSGKGEAPRLAFIAADVPACGFKTYYLGRSGQAAPPAPLSKPDPPGIDNERFHVEMRADGRLEIHDKVRNQPLGAKGPGGLGEVVFYEAPPPKDWMQNGPLGKRHAWTAKPGPIERIGGPVFSSLRAAGAIGPHAVTREVRLWRASRRIDYFVDIDAQEGCGVFCARFPVGLAGKVTAGIPFGAEPRDRFEQEIFRGEFFAQGCPEGFYANRWADVSTADRGCTFVCPAGAYTGYAWRAEEQSLEFILLRVRPMPEGTWGQMHPSIEGKGRHRFHYALAPHEATWREAASYRDALELHVPLAACVPGAGPPPKPADAAPPVGQPRAPEAMSLVEVRPANVVLSALRPVAPAKGASGPAWEMRLYETAGAPADVTIRLGCPVGAAEETNFLGRPTAELGKIDVADHEIRFRLGAWKIATLRVTPKGLRY